MRQLSPGQVLLEHEIQTDSMEGMSLCCEQVCLHLFQTEGNCGKFNTSSSALIQGTLRNLLAPRVYTLPMVRAVGRTMVQGKNYGPQITVKRLATR